VFPGEFGVPILYPTHLTDADAAESLERLCGNDARRRRIVGRVMRRLRRAEQPPGVLRRSLWRILPR
jgi:hypothetical protein